MNRKLLKILAGALGIGLIILLLIFVNSFVGNPISKALAKNAAESYIDTKYNELGLEIEKCVYNFKFPSYSVFVQSSTSEDTAFSINVDGLGNVLGDDYEFEVANNFSTFRRLEDELREIAKEVIGNELDYDFENIFLHFEKEADFMKLERDMKLDIHNPPLPLMADVTVYNHDVSYVKISEVAKALNTTFINENIPVDEYSIRIIPLSDKPQNEDQSPSWRNALSVSDFPANRLQEENLPSVMEQFEENRISQLNKEKK